MQILSGSHSIYNMSMIWYTVNYQKFMFIVLDYARNILILELIIPLKNDNH